MMGTNLTPTAPQPVAYTTGLHCDHCHICKNILDIIPSRPRLFYLTNVNVLALVLLYNKPIELFLVQASAP